jgi:hypothetical protein
MVLGVLHFWRDSITSNLNFATKWLSYKLSDETHFVLLRGLLKVKMPQPVEMLLF